MTVITCHSCGKKSLQLEKGFQRNFFRNLLDYQFHCMTVVRKKKESIAFLSDIMKMLFSIHQALSELSQVFETTMP